MVADLCLFKGWAVDFLGANTPTSAVVEMAKRRHAHLVALSVTMEQGMTHVQRLLDELAALSPAPNVVLGGQLFAANALPVSLQRGCVIARDADDGIELIGKLLRANRPKAVLKEYLLVLARRVRDLRSKKGWTQEQLAEATRVTRVCIVAVEGGKQNVSMDIRRSARQCLGSIAGGSAGERWRFAPSPEEECMKNPIFESASAAIAPRHQAGSERLDSGDEEGLAYALPDDPRLGKLVGFGAAPARWQYSDGRVARSRGRTDCNPR